MANSDSVGYIQNSDSRACCELCEQALLAVGGHQHVPVFREHDASDLAIPGFAKARPTAGGPTSEGERGRQDPDVDRARGELNVQVSSRLRPVLLLSHPRLHREKQ